MQSFEIIQLFGKKLIPWNRIKALFSKRRLPTFGKTERSTYDLSCFLIGPFVFWPSLSCFFELDLPCFNLVLLFFFNRTFSIFLSPSNLFSQGFPFLSQSFRLFCQSLSFFESVLPDFLSPAFLVNDSYFLTHTYHVLMMSVVLI